MKRVLALGMAVLAALAGSMVSASASTPSAPGLSAEAQRVIDFWTPERIAAARPRDLLLDPRGLAYMRLPSGALQPYGHSTPAQQAPLGDSVISNIDPTAGATIPTSYTFRATVTDTETVKSVSFEYQPVGSTSTTTRSASRLSGTNDWQLSVSFSGSGDWTWRVIVKDGGPKGGATFRGAANAFKVSAGGGGGGGPIVYGTEGPWTSGGDVQSAAGRILFEMPTGSTTWGYYVCSGTAVTDSVTQQSLVLTAAHCVYDDLYKVFARNVLFIPNQAGTTAAGTDTNCGNDPVGCWALDYGVVNKGWSSKQFPNNKAWDFGYYIVQTSGKHTAGLSAAPDSLESAVPELTPSFTAPTDGATTYALGYTYDFDPSFRYCSDPLTSISSANWWLATCGMTGGSSGGPWMQSASGAGPIVSVNSWGYTNSAGMAGAKFSGTTSKASCTYTYANTLRTFSVTARGYITSC